LEELTISERGRIINRFNIIVGSLAHQLSIMSLINIISSDMMAIMGDWKFPYWSLNSHILVLFLRIKRSDSIMLYFESGVSPEGPQVKG
jgi:hypothetical protein